MRLVYFSPLKWNSFTQRPHEFVRWFHSTHCADVLWIDPYPTRLPNIKDFGRFRKPKNFNKENNFDWLKVFCPRSVPLEPLSYVNRLTNYLYWRKIERIVQEFAENQTCYLYIGKPSTLAFEILKRNKFYRTFYDAMDDFPAFYKGISSRSIQNCEKKIIECVNHILVSSTHLAKRIKAMGYHVDLVRNGCASSKLPTRETVFSCNPPILGYVGTIGAWFDWDLVIEIAESVSDLCIDIIGPIFQRPKKPLPKNVTVMPPLHQSAALKRMATFSIGLIPFKRNRLTASVDPIKYYEYRGIGLPIISTDFGEMSLRNNEAGVYLIKNSSDIQKLVTQACAYKFKKNDIKKFRSDNDWKTRFDNAAISFADRPIEVA